MKIRWIILIIVLIVLGGSRYYTMATERGCGYNPIKHTMITAPECWCNNEEGVPIIYAGFRCNCEEVCNAIQK